MSYYHAEPGMKVVDIVRKWMNGEKMYDSSMPYFMDIDDLWKYRDYSWTKETSRMGHGLPYYVDEKQKHLNGPEKWDVMRDYMSKHGWDDREPAMLTVGKDGKAKLGEGNHRLAIFKELGGKKVPVRIFFYQNVYQTHPDFSRMPKLAETSFKQWLIQTASKNSKEFPSSSVNIPSLL